MLGVTSIRKKFRESIPENLTKDHLRRLGYESFWVVAGQALAAVGGLVGVRLLTGVLSPDVYGELALAMTIVVLVQTTLLGPLGGALLRYFAPAREEQQLPGYLVAAHRFLLRVTTAVLGLAVILVAALILTDQQEWLGLLFVGTLFTLLSGYSIALDGMQNAARQRIIVAWHRALRIWLQFLMAFAIVTRAGTTSTAAMAGYALSAVLVFGSQYAFFRLTIDSVSKRQPATSQEVSSTIFKQMQTYAWPLMAWGVFVWLHASADRWAIQAYGSTYDVGLFEVLYQLGYYPVSMGLGLIVQIMAPVFFEMAGRANDPGRMLAVRQLNQQMLTLTLMLAIAGVTLSYWLHSLIFSLAAAPEYREVSSLMPAMVLAAGLFASSQVAGQLVAVCFKTRMLLAPHVGIGVIGFLASFVTAKFWGLQGVAVAGILVGLLQLLWILRVRRSVFSSHLQQLLG